MITAFVIGLTLVVGILILIRAIWWPQELSTAICQTGDLGERFVSRPVGTVMTVPYFGEEVVEYYAVTLEDLSLSNTVLNCEIIEYGDETAAHRAFERGCDPDSTLETPSVGDEACQFTTSAPHGFAFRRDNFLVRMSGDVTNFPAQAVDDRLK